MPLSRAKTYGSPRLVNLVRAAPGDIEFNFRAVSAILKRLKPKATIRTYFNALIDVDLADYIPLRLFWFGRWEPRVSRIVEDILAPGDTFLDVGANIGYYSTLASGLVGPSGRVVAIEASPPIFEALIANVKLNNLSNVALKNVAASDHHHTVTIYQGRRGNSGTSTIVEGSGRPAVAKIAAVPVDELLSPSEIATLKLIKIDIEGAELSVMQRILATIDSFPRDLQIIVEFTPIENDGGWHALLDNFLKQGFKAFAIENDYRWKSYCEINSSDSALTPITRLPTTTSDVLLRRP